MTTTPSAGLTAGLRTLADLIDTNPDLYDDLQYCLDSINVPVSSAIDPRARMAAWLRAGKAAGLPVNKSYEDGWGNVDITCGPLTMHVYARREQVCDRIVTGTREVTREIPDPAVVVPTVTVTETVEDVTWNCLPLLDDTRDGETSEADRDAARQMRVEQVPA